MSKSGKRPYQRFPVGRLLQVEWAMLHRDPVYLFMVLSPMLIGLFVRYALPRLFSLLLGYTGFDMVPYIPLVHFFFLQIPPYIAGVMVGLLFLEERDQSLPEVWAVSPLGRSGYLLWKAFFTFFAALIMALGLLLLLPGRSLAMGELLLLIPLSATAPLSFFLLALFGEDKIGGLALAKLNGMVLILPLLVLLPHSLPLRWVINILSPVWMVRSWLSMDISRDGGLALVYCGIALLLQLLPLFLGLSLLFRARVLPIHLSTPFPRRRAQSGG